jgi:iron-sulfur cluster assembly protein
MIPAGQVKELIMITITDLAVSELRRVLLKKGNPDLGLRVFVSPGGCSGFSYGMTFEENPGEDDQIIEHEGIKIIVDDVSTMYLSGAEIDYVDSLMGGGFTVYNPNAVSTCSCGTSFQAASGEGAPRPCH